MSDLRDLYQEVILDHGKRPRNFRHPADANREAKGDNPLCGDKVTIYLKLSDKGLIEDLAFEGRGCAISTASASMMTEILKGKTEAEAEALFGAFHQMCTTDDEPTVSEALQDDFDRLQVMSGVRHYPMRVKCATLAWHTMKAALEGADQPVRTE
jgi:nitrogen fixation protein NifU and related proteins